MTPYELFPRHFRLDEHLTKPRSAHSYPFWFSAARRGDSPGTFYCATREEAQRKRDGLANQGFLASDVYESIP